jgi:plasmid maintenance system antidote protein VapI
MQPRRPSTGSTLLRQWMTRQHLSGRAVAELLQIHPTVLSSMLTGHRRPSLGTALRIERLTGIVPRAWQAPDRGHKGES